MGIISDYRDKRRLAAITAGANGNGGGGPAKEQKMSEQDVQKGHGHGHDDCHDDHDEHCYGSFGGSIRLHCKHEHPCYCTEVLRLPCEAGPQQLENTIENWINSHQGGRVVQVLDLGHWGWLIVFEYPH